MKKQFNLSYVLFRELKFMFIYIIFLLPNIPVFGQNNLLLDYRHSIYPSFHLYKDTIAGISRSRRGTLSIETYGLPWYWEITLNDSALVSDCYFNDTAKYQEID